MITLKWSRTETARVDGTIVDLGNYPSKYWALALGYAEGELAHRLVAGGLRGHAGEFRFKPGPYPAEDGINWVEPPEATNLR